MVCWERGEHMSFQEFKVPESWPFTTGETTAESLLDETIEMYRAFVADGNLVKFQRKGHALMCKLQEFNRSQGGTLMGAIQDPQRLLRVYRQYQRLERALFDEQGQAREQADARARLALIPPATLNGSRN